MRMWLTWKPHNWFWREVFRSPVKHWEGQWDRSDFWDELTRVWEANIGWVVVAMSMLDFQQLDFAVFATEFVRWHSNGSFAGEKHENVSVDHWMAVEELAIVHQSLSTISLDWAEIFEEENVERHVDWFVLNRLGRISDEQSFERDHSNDDWDWQMNKEGQHCWRIQILCNTIHWEDYRID